MAAPLLPLPEQGRPAPAAQHTYMLAIAACRARSGGDRPDYAERVERVVEALRRTGTEPSPEVMCRIAMAYVRSHKWERAAACFEESVRANCFDRRVWDGCRDWPCPNTLPESQRGGTDEAEEAPERGLPKGAQDVGSWLTRSRRLGSGRD